MSLTAQAAEVNKVLAAGIDLYEADSDFRYGAETPDNPDTTMRVLTIMLARDW